MKVLCLGDVVGCTGVENACRLIEDVRVKEKPDVIIVNIENSGPLGKGIATSAVDALKNAGAMIFTGGNHSFARRESYEVYQKNKEILRPCNYPNGAPGSGHIAINVVNGKKKVIIISVQLRVFMKEDLGCPFKAVESILGLYEDAIIIIDMHGEATAEKVSFAYFFDGRVSAIFGTHTHVQTADERILPKGTGYITDVGMSGALNSSIGMKLSATISNFVTQLPSKFEVEDNKPFISNAILFSIDQETKKTTHVKRIYEIFN
jgi:metallophosphoesterase (TIGR00282 family)